ncbi:MAG: hypothetical protein ISR90_07010 [Candidatus Marinimicrobia bacterium]|nr:hypothetical protein [Candidatus Neomarinimicrobiota bacterium]
MNWLEISCDESVNLDEVFSTKINDCGGYFKVTFTSKRFNTECATNSYMAVTSKSFKTKHATQTWLKHKLQSH